MRWGVPIAAAAVIGAAIGAGPVIAAVSGDPVLPERTAAQLLADAAAAVKKAGGPPAMSGTVQQTASLGLPALPGQGGAASPLALLSGSHEVKVWYGSQDRLRIALPGQMSETNLIVNGDQTWYWDSGTNTATKVKLPAKTEQDQKLPTPGPTDLTPQQVAETFLDRVNEDTGVSVTNTSEVAGRPVYQLVLTPKAQSSLVKEVRLALDGENYMPLQVQVFAKESAEPAFQVGFTQVTFSPPAEENFVFTPPAGAKVEEAELGKLREPAAADHSKEAGKAAEQVKVVGDGWTSVAVLPFEQKGQQGRQDSPEAQAAKVILDQATPVSGTWGSGKLIRTKLVTALLTDDGRLLAGAVTPDELVKVAGR
ncbi:outer membrane lipoprotein carrier protein LolA [Nonomuraea sp. NPDC050790]|uniref:outer membrane lipoprotein carrier protein LolA n=1 Tax=Nonomuraea sp. NPDC050790 TaxID=3364371 RepID=UPI0037ACB6A5